MNRSVWSGAVIAVGILGACSAEDEPTPPGGGGQEPVGVLDRVDLRAELGAADVAPIGVTRAGDRTFVFDDALGIRELGGGLTIPTLPDPGVEVRFPFTDLAWLGGDEFVVTAIGDGFVLDADAGTLVRRFCYEPGFEDPGGQLEWTDAEQRTDAVAVAPEAGLIYAQPRTDRISDGGRIASSIATYDAPTGTVLEWRDLDPSFTSTGMAIAGGGRLVLSSGSKLYTYDLEAWTLTETADLARFGARDITGLAIDAGSLIVVDADKDQLIELDRAVLGI